MFLSAILCPSFRLARARLQAVPRRCLDWLLACRRGRDDAGHASNLVAVAALYLAQAPFSLWAYWRAGYWLMVGLNLMQAALVVGSLWALRRGTPALTAGRWVALSFLALCGGVALVSGGVRAMVAPTLVVLPLVATFLAGRRFGLISGLGVAAHTVLLIVLERYGLLPGGPLSSVQNYDSFCRVLLSDILIVTLLAFVFETEKMRRYGSVETARRQAEDTVQQLQVTQKQLILQEKMAGLGTLTAGIAHEINNPANFAHAGSQVLSGEIEQLRRFLLVLAGDDADAAVRLAINQRFDAVMQHLGTVLEGTGRIRDLVKDLRAFTRLDDTSYQAVDICDSLNATLNLVRTQYDAEVRFETRFAFRPLVECRPALINQVFMNLIVNACQAIQSQRQRSGSTRPGLLTIRSRAEGDWLVLEFEDNGCGMSEQTMNRIFEPFFTTKDVGEGTGLGLSISFGIVEKHGGRIAVRAAPLQGSCFTLMLPLEQAHAEDL